MIPKRAQGVFRVNGSDRKEIFVARTYFARLRGLLGFRREEAWMWLEPGNSVHGMGMTFTLDVAQISSDGQVLAIKRLRPFGLVKPRKGTRSVLEAPAGSFATLGLRVGDHVAVHPIETRP